MRRRNRANRRRRSRDQSSGDPRLGAHDITANRRRRRRARAADAIRPRRRYTGLGRPDPATMPPSSTPGDGAQRGHRGRRAAFSARLEHARTDRGARGHRGRRRHRGDGGAHHRVLVALAAPSTTPADVVVGINRGVVGCAAALGASVLGGDLVEASDVSVSITAVGVLDGREPVRVSGARPGDVLAVSGPLGASAAGYAVLASGVDLLNDPAACEVVSAFRCPAPDLGQGPVPRARVRMPRLTSPMALSWSWRCCARRRASASTWIPVPSR